MKVLMILSIFAKIIVFPTCFFYPLAQDHSRMGRCAVDGSSKHARAPLSLQGYLVGAIPRCPLALLALCHQGAYAHQSALPTDHCEFQKLSLISKNINIFVIFYSYNDS